MRQYGCVMLNVPLQGWSDVLMRVDQDDIYDPDGDHGFSLYPHITVLYGIHQLEKPLDMMLYIDSICRQIKVEFTGISVFENEKFDVLKFGVNAPVLKKYHDKIKGKFEHTEEFSQYSPHMTIAYIKKNTAWKYNNLAFSMPVITVDLMRFTNADGHETLIKLKPNE